MKNSHIPMKYMKHSTLYITVTSDVNQSVGGTVETIHRGLPNSPERNDFRSQRFMIACQRKRSTWRKQLASHPITVTISSTKGDDVEVSNGVILQAR